MSEVVVWEEPTGPERRDWSVIADTLRANPKQWGRVEGISTTREAHYINSGKTKAFQPAGSFQAMARKGNVYARFLGGDQ